MKKKDGGELVRDLVEARRRRHRARCIDAASAPRPLGPAFDRRGAQIITFKEFSRRRRARGR